jgi:hypothetical protein
MALLTELFLSKLLIPSKDDIRTGYGSTQLSTADRAVDFSQYVDTEVQKCQ